MRCDESLCCVSQVNGFLRINSNQVALKRTRTKITQIDEICKHKPIYLDLHCCVAMLSILKKNEHENTRTKLKYRLFCTDSMYRHAISSSECEDIEVVDATEGSTT